MTNWTQAKGPGDSPKSNAITDVACPFCGLVCDDLEMARDESGLKVTKNGCEKAVAGFERKVDGARPQVDGRDVDLETAIRAATDLIRKSSLPLFGGLGTDVNGIRSVLALADKAGGVIDHALSEGQYRNFRVLQTTGWIMTTLTEARNRADVFVIVGSDLQKLHPRFFERIVNVEQSLLSEAPPKRTVVFIGKGLDQSGVKGSRIGEIITLPCELDRISEVVAALAAEIRGTPPSADTVAGVPTADIKALAERCRAASYPVFVWAPPSLAFPNADLVVNTVSDLVKDLNVKGRAAGLALGGNEGAISAGAVSSWQSGYPLRVSFASGKPDYDFQRYAIPSMLANGEGDLLVWLASFTPDLGPPATKLPTIVLGTPGIKLQSTPAVFIPVGTPGADHGGRIIRVDNVVSLPLRDLGRSNLPKAADIFAAIELAL
ncbi:formylmethanofuran dehydrogenase [Hyphomicrobium sp. LHD-15]|uniref:formylmethanofuran dehydrogenase n=1 Tax=Hyphomicrobium sp. LHD-15 TaxID=3072142 RepID=UPI00280F6E55|nr:formylmethanofuran dehydrogenase [Hyphomicrobium sp. LHD-15]MDQ8697425.1 formylmethanofuran dehydrogenase [Hyphomicrobium sp. LHD-15]